MQGGRKNMMDEAILTHACEKGIVMAPGWKAVAEIAFDYERRIVSVILKKDSSAQPLLICKVRLRNALLCN